MNSPDSSEKIPYRRCGASGLALPAISLGLWHNFGDGTPYATGRAMVLEAFDLGITHFDLANNYGPPPGSAEGAFGRILRTELRAHRDELIVSTKAGFRMWPGPYGDGGSRKSLLASLDQSLRRLGLPYVDIFYSHRPDPDTPLDETLGALETAVRSGRALYVGLSNYPAETTARAARQLRERGVPCLIHQPKYNLFDRQPEAELLDVLETEGIGAIAYCPLAQGLLAGRYLDGIPADSRAARGGFLKPEHVTDRRVAQTRALNELARERGQSLPQMALSWVLRDSRISSALIGASRPEQIRENAAAAQAAPFRAEELERIDAIAAEV